MSALSAGNTITPSGSVRIGDHDDGARQLGGSDVQELTEIPVRTGAGHTVYLRDVGYVEDASDTLTSHALVNGRRSVYTR